jgi:hypothetical protein
MQFGGRPWGDDDEPVPSCSTARSQTRNQGKETAQGKRKAMVLTAGQRCRRRRLDGDGGAVWMFALVPSFSFCFGLSAPAWASSSLAASGPVACRRRCGARLLPPRLHSYPASTLLPPLRRRSQKGVNPKRALACARGSALCYWRPVKAAQGQRSADGAPIGGFPRGGDVDGHQWWLSPLSVIGRGKRGNFPSQNPLEWVTGARASLTCVPALRPGGPIRAHGCGAPSAMWCGEALGRTEKKTVWPTCGPHTPVRGKKRGEALVSWAAQVKRLMG